MSLSGPAAVNIWGTAPDTSVLSSSSTRTFIGGSLPDATVGPNAAVLDAGERHRDRKQNHDEAWAAEDAKQVMARDDERTHVYSLSARPVSLMNRFSETGLLDCDFTHVSRTPPRSPSTRTAHAPRSSR